MGAAVAREAEALTTWQPTDLRSVRLSEVGSDGFRRSWIMYMPLGKFKHPEYGKLNFTRQFLSEIKRKFDSHVRGIDIALDTDHREGPAPGWIEKMELREAAPGHPAGLYAQIKWTPLGVQLLQEQQYRYFSPEFGSHFDEDTGRKIKDVALGGALTNRPFLKSMPSVQLAEVSRTPWGQIDKACLPDSAFLDAKNRRLPVYEGTGPKDAKGRYTRRGKLNINGVHAALAAVHGAHTGKAMTGLPAGIAGKLQGWLDRYDGGSGSGDAGKAASEAAARGGGITMGKAHGRGAQESQRLADYLDSEDEEVFEELDEDGERRTFAQSTTPIKSPTDWTETGDLFDDVTGEDNMYADGADGNDDGDGFDPGSDTHGPANTDGHVHGKFAEHPHNNDADHSDAPVKRGKSMSRKAAEPRQVARPRTLAEASRRLAEYEARDRAREEQVKTLAERAYREDVRKFSEALSNSVKLEGVEVKTSRRFSQAFEDFMFNEGRDLDDAGRRKVVKLIQTAYRYGPVMTSQYALTEPPEGTEAPVYGIDRGAEPVRRERRLGGGVAEVETGDNVLRLAEQIAQQRHKRPLGQLKQDEADVILSEAAQRGNYRGAETVRGR